MKRRLQRFFQIAIILFVFGMMLSNVKAQTIGSQIRIGADSTISYWNGSSWITVAPGLPGQSLRFTNGVPTWIDGPQTPPHDIDGNIYEAVTIGTQTWMKQNLNVTHYSNGDAITFIANANTNTWHYLITEAYCNYNNDPNYATTYGRLYNFYAVTDSRNLCPTGWHVPSDADWTTLTTYLGGESIAGAKLMETGSNHWMYNTRATNESNFTALPGGGLIYNTLVEVFSNITQYGYWWNSSNNLVRNIFYNGYNVNKYYSPPTDGLSVSCLKD